MGDDGLDDFLRKLISSASVLSETESLDSVVVVWTGVRYLDELIDGKLGLSGCRSIVGRTGVLDRSESDDLVMAAVSADSGESDGRRI